MFYAYLLPLGFVIWCLAAGLRPACLLFAVTCCSYRFGWLFDGCLFVVGFRFECCVFVVYVGLVVSLVWAGRVVGVVFCFGLLYVFGVLIVFGYWCLAACGL